MNLTNAPLGYAFEGDYGESYEAPTLDLQQVLQRQLDELNRIGSPARAAEILGILRGRRCGHKDLLQLDVQPRRGGSACLLARGEIVMPAAGYADDRVQQIVKARGFDACPARQHDLLRLRHPTGFLSNVERTLDECGSQGVTGWPNYVATLAAVGKGIGGPEPVQSLGAFSPYEQSPSGTTWVAVIDTGIPSGRRGDGWLDSVERTKDNIDELDVLPAGPDDYLDFQAGHGTFVAGIVQRVARGAGVRVYRAADTDGFASDDDIAHAMLQAYREGAQIINLSLGGRTADDEPPPAMAEAVRSIRSDSDGEVVIVAAAGNFGDGEPCWPAWLDGVEAVAGLTARLTPARWSSYGPVRFSTVAEGIRSTFVTGHESPVFDREPEVFGADAWAMWSGTSFASPQIAGAVARVCQETGMTARQAVDKLDDRGKPIPGYGKAMRILEGIR